MFDMGDRLGDAMMGDSTPDDADDAICALDDDVFAFFAPLLRKMANGESADQRELAVDAERRLG